MSDNDLFSPARLRAKWRRAGKPEAEEHAATPVSASVSASVAASVATRGAASGTAPVAAPVAAPGTASVATDSPISLAEHVSELRRRVSEQVPNFDRFMEHGFDSLAEGVEAGDPIAMAEALNSIEDLVDESGLKSR